jgi:hypothetical protein
MATGWIVVSFFTMFVALSMAEIVSAIPTRFDAQSPSTPYMRISSSN